MIIDNELHIDQNTWDNTPEEVKQIWFKIHKEVVIYSMEDWHQLGLLFKEITKPKSNAG